MPVTQGVYWFASAYFIMFLLSPFLNRLLQSLDRRNYQALLLTMFVIFSLVPTFLRVKYQIPNLMVLFPLPAGAL